MTGKSPFTPPLRATGHCRHYSYRHGNVMADRGPQCAVGVDLSAPGASTACWPEPQSQCARRQEYTAEERAAWQAWTNEGLQRLQAAIAALPAPIPMNSTGRTICPSCGGDLHYSRWYGGAALQCGTGNCCSARFNIAAGANWPAPKPADV